MQMYPEPTGKQGRHQGSCGLCLAHPGDVERHHLVHSRQHCNGHIKTLELQGRIAHEQD